MFTYFIIDNISIIKDANIVLGISSDLIVKVFTFQVIRCKVRTFHYVLHFGQQGINANHHTNIVIRSKINKPITGKSITLHAKR